MTFDLATVAAAIGAAGTPPPALVTGWSVDSRTQNPGDAYFAIRGPNHDGHQFVDAVLTNGAAGAVVERPGGSARELQVADTRRALGQLAAWARAQWGGVVIGVTGSAGKTTTKDIVAHLLAVEHKVGRTVGNLNNDIGVPLSILRLPEDCRMAVLEMGMNHAGEIRDLAAIARPDCGIVTNVGYAHAEFFESIDGIAAAKRELIEGLPEHGIAILNADDERVRRFRDTHSGRAVLFGFAEDADVRATNVEATASGTRFDAMGVAFETGLTGRHSVLNLLAGIAAATSFGIAPERLRDAVRSFAAGKMRGERLEQRGIVIWNDCYNSNPEAARSMLDVLRQTSALRRIAVLGEMRELGNSAAALHCEVGTYAAQSGVDYLVGVGGHARDMVEGAVAAGMPREGVQFFENSVDAGDFVRQVARAGDAVLFKGSRGVRVELALERFLA